MIGNWRGGSTSGVLPSIGHPLSGARGNRERKINKQEEDNKVSKLTMHSAGYLKKNYLTMTDHLFVAGAYSVTTTTGSKWIVLTA